MKTTATTAALFAAALALALPLNAPALAQTEGDGVATPGGAIVSAPAIENVAPEKTVLVLGVRNWQASMDKLKNHPAFHMLRNEGRAAAADSELLEMIPEPMRQTVKEMLGGREMPMPRGSIGLAIYAAVDPELGFPQPAVLALIDYGDRAGEVADLVRQAVEKAGEQQGLAFQMQDVQGRQVISVDLPEKAPDDGQDQMDAQNPMGMIMPDLGDMFELDRVHFVRSGPSVLVGSDLPGLTSALTALSGGERGVLADSRAFQGVMKQVGDGSDAYFALMPDDLDQVLAGAGDPMLFGMIQPMIRAILGDVKGYGYAMELGEGAGLMEQRASMYMPNGKQGLPALLDTPSVRKAPPAFVPADVISYTTLSIEFENVVPFIQRFMQSNPMLGAQVGPQWQQMQPVLGRLFAALEPRLHLVSLPDRGGEGAGAFVEPVVALQIADADAFRGAVKELTGDGQQQAPAPQDVPGGRLYTFSDPAAAGGGGGGMMMMPMPDVVLGISTDDRLAWIGPPAQVKARLAAPQQEHALHQAPAFRRTAEMIPDDVVAWGFSDLGRALGLMGDAAAPAGVEAEELQQHIGTSVWFVRSTPEGFVTTMRQLPPKQAVQVEEAR